MNLALLILLRAPPAVDSRGLEGDPPAPAKAPAPEPAWFAGGFVDTQYVVNTNFPDNHIFRGTAVTARTGEFSPNLVVAYVRRDPVRQPWMMELALQWGSAPAALYAAEPVAGGPYGRYAGVEVFQHINKAWAGARLKRGTELAAGLMGAPTHFGSFWTKDNWHSSITWGFSSAPFYLMGIRMWQPLGRRAGVGLWLVDGYGVMGDVNKAPSGLVNLVATPVEGLSLVQNVYGGPEAEDLRPEAWRLLVESQVVYDRETWGFALVGDYGRERLTFAVGAPVAHWANGMLSVRWHVLGRKHRWGMAVRPEFFWDHGGRIFGAPDRNHWMVAGTYTNDIRLFDALLLRVEYRYDHSTAANGYWYRHGAIADDATSLASSQHSVIFNVIGYFERAIAAWKR